MMVELPIWIYLWKQEGTGAAERRRAGRQQLLLCALAYGEANRVAGYMDWPDLIALDEQDEEQTALQAAGLTGRQIEGQTEAQATGQTWKQAAGPTAGLSRTLPLIARETGGKPYFPWAPGLHFSLSHSGALAACAFGGRRLGLDLQQHRACAGEAITRRFFHPLEQAYLADNLYKDFFPVWAAKESYLKYTGAGLAGGLDSFCVTGENGLKERLPAAGHAGGDTAVCFYRPDTAPGYSLCLCAAKTEEVKIIEFTADCFCDHHNHEEHEE